MTPDPQSTDESNQPPQRQLPKQGAVAKDVSEADLWDLDDEQEMEKPDLVKLPSPRQTPIIPRKALKKPVKNAVPVKQASETPAPEVEPGEETKQPTAKKKSPKRKTGNQSIQPQPSQLDASRDLLHHKDLEEAASVDGAEPAQLTLKEPLETTAGEQTSLLSDDTFDPDEDELSVDAAPATTQDTGYLREKAFRLTRAEKIGLAAVLVLLLGGSLFFLVNAVYKLPPPPVLLGNGGFPVKGNYSIISNAETYWKAPAVSSSRTQMVPVLKISLQNSTGAIRVFFRDADGKLVGDGLNRNVKNSETLEIPATAGFEEQGMLAAYRVGEGNSWTVEVFEGPSEDAPISKFKKVYETRITANYR